jgi:hypothetical protein
VRALMGENDALRRAHKEKSIHDDELKVPPS